MAPTRRQQAPRCSVVPCYHGIPPRSTTLARSPSCTSCFAEAKVNVRGGVHVPGDVSIVTKIRHCIIKLGCAEEMMTFVTSSYM